MVDQDKFLRVGASNNDDETSQENQDSSVFKEGAKRNVKSFGYSGTEIFGGIFSEEYLQKLQGIPGAKEYDRMRRSEAQIAMLLSAIKNPIKSANWDIEPADVNDEQSVKIAALIKSILFEQMDIETFKHEALTFIEFGNVVFEVVHNYVTNHPIFGTFNGLAGLKFRSQKTVYEWNLDKKTGNLMSVTQQIVSDVGTNCTIPGEFLLVLTQQKEGDNYEGISSLRPVYGAWVRKNLYLKLIAIGLEKYAIGTPIGTTPKTVGQKSPEFETFKDMLRSYTSNEKAFLMLPEGYKVELQFGDFDAEKVKSVILMENSEMVNAFVANFLSLGMNGSGGSFSLGTDLSDFFLSGIQCYADIISGGVNRKLIPELVKLNYGPQAKYPKLKITGINDKAGKEFADIVGNLIEKNALKADDPLESFLRKEFRLPKADPTTSRAQADKNITATINPNLPSQEAGSDIPDQDVQKLSLNGAQVASLLSIVQRVAAGLIPRDSGVAMIETAFSVTPEQANAMMGSVGKGFTADPNAVAALGAQLAEQRIKLDEKYRKEFDKSADKVKALMSEQMTLIYEDLKKQIANGWKGASPDSRVKIAAQLDPKFVPQYKAVLKEAMAEIGYNSREAAKKYTPRVKLSERLKLAAAPNGGFYAALPKQIRNLIETQAALIADTQAANLTKAVAFQFTSSESGSPDVEQILFDIDQKVQPMLDGSQVSGVSLDAAAANVVATIGNQAQMSWFFEPEVFAEIESFTFTNEDPVSEICQSLAGETFAANDPAVDTYGPPLHHLCKSRFVPNMRGDDGNPEINLNAGKGLSQKALKAITLHECEYCDYKIFKI